MKTKKIIITCILIGISICPLNLKAQTKNNWRINLLGGVGYQPDNQLKWGLQGSAGINYFFHSNWGAGIKYSFFTADDNWDWQQTVIHPSPANTPPTYWIVTANTQATSSIHYIGPSLCARIRIGNSKWVVSSVLSGGGVYDKIIGETTITDIQSSLNSVISNQSTSSIFNSNSEGNVKIVDLYDPSDRIIPENFVPEPSPVVRKGFGAYIGIGSEYPVNKHIALGADCGYFHSFLSKDKNISRIDFSLGIKIYL